MVRNQKFDVYGIGNALVDMEYSISNNFFLNHKIEKGVMTLISEERQNEILMALDAENCKRHKMSSGGSAANTIIAVGQLGGKGFYSCKVANDQTGHFFLKDLKGTGIQCNLNEANLSQGTTGKCLVMVGPDADRTMNTFLGITSTFSKAELDLNALSESNYLYIEGYLVASPTGLEAAIFAREEAEKKGVKVALTFSDPNMVQFFGEGLRKIIGPKGVDLIFCNEQEALTFAGTQNLREARETLKKYARTFVITLGENGAMIFDGTTFIDIEPYKVKAIDSNGAGDMFAGAFLYGLTHNHSYAQAGKLASLLSSKVVSQYGPRLEWFETQEILNQLLNNK